MQCPVCSGPMWDNRENKKNPKGPDYACKNKTCKYTLDPDSKEYVPGEYPTGVWLPKAGSTSTIPPEVRAQAMPPGYPGSPKLIKEEPDWDAIAQGKVRHGVVCALIQAGKTQGDVFKEAPAYVDYIINGQPF